ncbi:tetratricopeptide repeat protein [Streptomyces sp. NBC_00237]|uniref:tetratricopeptide repeat protein n=1 Tax=Streptomyces sp. NBC_00237 TaxID=2975687 RepID=UPI00225472D7|nr:tetratricopeptide repeat protein [Streptomyces sp. NBC_00237]MCX5201018.1 tetratricopeptide repeat protein [Streptomyces sp. NBC_00237]
MASSSANHRPPPPAHPRRAEPNLAFRALRGHRSPGEFAASVRRAAREIGEQVACDARYIGRVEAGEIRCPNYAYERVFLHMFPGLTLSDLGFTAREAVRGRGARGGVNPPPSHSGTPASAPAERAPRVPGARTPHLSHTDEESDVLRRAFIASGSATAATASAFGPLGALGPLDQARARTGVPGRGSGRPGVSEAAAVEEAVRQIRLLDDRHGADALYRHAAKPLQAAYALLDAGTVRRTVSDRLHAGAGELALTVGWLAHDSGRFDEARSHYAEALATARVAEDPALEAHAFCNTSFLARDAGRPREALRAAQAGLRAARGLGSMRLMSLLTLREAAGWAALGDRTGCTEALVRAKSLFQCGASAADPEWMSFFGDAEVAWLEAQCWSALGDWRRAARFAHRAAALQDPHFTRNLALYSAELADDLARSGVPDEAAAVGQKVLDLLEQVQSSRVHTMLAQTIRTLLPHRRSPVIGAFLERHANTVRRA